MKTLDKEGLQYTLQRMVTLLAAIQEKVNVPCPEYKEGTFIPKFWNASSVEQTFDWVEGHYTKIGNLCYIRIMAQASSDVDFSFIDNLPFAPNTNIYHTLYEKGLVFANGERCNLNASHNRGQISITSVAIRNLLVEGIYHI